MAEAADYLRVSRDTIYRWAREGRLTLYKLGKLTRLKRSELDKLIAPKGAGVEKEKEKEKEKKKEEVDPWTALSQEAFSDWDNPEDAVYDRWEELYGLREG